MLTFDKFKKNNASRRSSAEGESLVEKISTKRKEIIKSLACAQAYQACLYNKFYCKMIYKVGQKVWLKVKNITIELRSQKLVWRRYSFYRIIKKIGKVAYCLNLPVTLQINNVFYISSFLHNYKPRVEEKLPDLQLFRLVINY